MPPRVESRFLLACARLLLRGKPRHAGSSPGCRRRDEAGRRTNAALGREPLSASYGIAPLEHDEQIVIRHEGLALQLVASWLFVRLYPTVLRSESAVGHLITHYLNQTSRDTRMRINTLREPVRTSWLVRT